MNSGTLCSWLQITWAEVVWARSSKAAHDVPLVVSTSKSEVVRRWFLLIFVGVACGPGSAALPGELFPEQGCNVIFSRGETLHGAWLGTAWLATGMAADTMGMSAKISHQNQLSLLVAEPLARTFALRAVAGGQRSGTSNGSCSAINLAFASWPPT